MSAELFSVTPEVVKEFLTGAGEFLEPARLLVDLSEAQSLAVPVGALYSIAQIVAHMLYWQDQNIRLAQGGASPRPEHLEETFPVVATGEWEGLRTAFLAGLETCALVADEKGEGVSSERDDRTVGYELAACPALHNAYHYGQIAVLRQIQGLWPPPGGDGGW